MLLNICVTVEIIINKQTNIMRKIMRFRNAFSNTMMTWNWRQWQASTLIVINQFCDIEKWLSFWFALSFFNFHWSMPMCPGTFKEGKDGVEVMGIVKIHFWNACGKGSGILQKPWGKQGNGDNVEFLGISELNVTRITIALEDQHVMLSFVMDQVPEVLILY